jgi:hypothetical protein
MPGISSKKIHLPLPVDLHAELMEQAERLGTPATVLARQAVAEWVIQKKQEQITEELRAYVSEMAGTGIDLDADLEAAGIESWLKYDS